MYLILRKADLVICLLTRAPSDFLACAAVEERRWKGVTVSMSCSIRGCEHASDLRYRVSPAFDRHVSSCIVVTRRVSALALEEMVLRLLDDAKRAGKRWGLGVIVSDREGGLAIRHSDHCEESPSCITARFRCSLRSSRCYCYSAKEGLFFDSINTSMDGQWSNAAITAPVIT